MAKKTEKETLIHVRFEYPEALNSKRNILSLEMNLLKTAKIIRRYYELRQREIETKIALHETVKNLNYDLTRTKSLLPKFETRELSKVKTPIEHHKVYEKDETLEAQLREIQMKLNVLNKSH